MEEENKEDVNTGANEPAETENGNTQDLQSFDDILKNKKYQAEFDRRMQQAIKTHDEKIKEINDKEKSEAERLAKMNKEQKLEYQAQKEKEAKEEALAKLNAYELKDQATNIASEKGMDVSLLNFFDFKHIKAEELNTKIDEISNAFNKAVEKEVNKRLQEDTPIEKNNNETAKKKFQEQVINRRN